MEIQAMDPPGWQGVFGMLYLNPVSSCPEFTRFQRADHVEPDGKTVTLNNPETPENPEMHSP